MTKPCVLIVDDSKTHREVMKAFLFLLPNPPEVLEASDGEEALGIATTRQPNLIIADFKMPRLNGLELLTALRRSSRTVNVPVVLLTAERDPNLSGQARSAGAREVFRKPLGTDALADLISRYVNKASG